MRIRVQALGGLTKEDLVCEMDVREGTTVDDVAKSLPLKETPFLIFLANGSRVSGNYPLQEGDSLIIFPPVLGG
ncbi:MAG: MoaD/ThiS family protein [Caldiserica bacterium]|nr:MoaD/ThiS family protein [Caldisericota bacterium]MDH7563178.1 MoaD/ThiS family protein [Caldisericota bacterium]